jgi:hypothetical protein
MEGRISLWWRIRKAISKEHDHHPVSFFFYCLLAIRSWKPRLWLLAEFRFAIQQQQEEGRANCNKNGLFERWRGSEVVLHIRRS